MSQTQEAKPETNGMMPPSQFRALLVVFLFWSVFLFWFKLSLFLPLCVSLLVALSLCVSF